jgi:maleylpyruvate isomerase
VTAPALRLYGYWRSSSTWRVRIGLRLKGLAYETAPVNLLAGEQHAEAYAAINPLGMVPALEVTEDGRTVRLAQSLAILEWLEERFPSPPLLPAAPLARAKARQLAELVNSSIQPLHNQLVLQRVEAAGLDRKEWGSFWVRRGLAALEREAAGTAGRFLVGDAPTLADACLVPQLYAARRFGVEPAVYPTLARIEETCASLPAFREAHPDMQPDAHPAGG